MQSWRRFLWSEIETIVNFRNKERENISGERQKPEWDNSYGSDCGDIQNVRGRNHRLLDTIPKVRVPLYFCQSLTLPGLAPHKKGKGVSPTLH